MSCRLIYTLLLIWSGTSSIFAQDANAPKRFRVLGWGALSEKLYYTQSELPPPPDQDNPIPLPGPDFKETELTVLEGSRSIFYDFDPSKPLDIIRHDGSKIVLVSSFDLSNHSILPLLLISVDSNKAYKIRIIDDSKASFPGGSFMMFNFSRVPVDSKFINDTGTTTATLQPQETKTVKPTFVDQKATELLVKIADTQRLVYSSNWVLKNNFRYLIFFVDDPRQPGSVHFLRVSDTIQELDLPQGK